MLHLITGGARSGKSALAETLAGRHGGPVSCLVTADVRDTEFAARVAAHRARRPAGWQVVETGQGLAEALSQHARPDGVLLVDCLGMWLMRFLDDVSGFDAYDSVILGSAVYAGRWRRPAPASAASAAWWSWVSGPDRASGSGSMMAPRSTSVWLIDFGAIEPSGNRAGAAMEFVVA